MIVGLDIYIRNSIIYNEVEGNEYIIACGKDDKHQPVIRKVEISYLLTLDTVAYADRIIQLVNDIELRTFMEEKSRVLFPGGSFIKNRNKYLQNQYNMVYNLRYGGENLVFLKMNVDTIVLVSIGHESTLISEERMVAA
ncbi:hypothetical protein AAA090_13570 [Segatella copri]|uniref:hypothetical protein n=1 Tax=Segatella copri TaxID=165179 RepID=UPI0032BF99F2